MSIQGQWAGSWQGSWFGATSTPEPPIFADTHDAYFQRLWKRLKENPKSSLEALKERFEEIEEQIEKVKEIQVEETLIYTDKKSVSLLTQKTNLIEELIKQSAKIRREIEDEEEAEMLLLML